MPTETAAAGVVWAKWGHVFGGALGIAATLAMMQTMTARQMVLATSSGLASSLFGTPVAIAIATGYLPAGVGHEVIEGMAGMFGFTFGMLGLYLAGGLIRMAESFRDNPWGIIDRLRGRKEDKE